MVVVVHLLFAKKMKEIATAGNLQTLLVIGVLNKF